MLNRNEDLMTYSVSERARAGMRHARHRGSRWFVALAWLALAVGLSSVQAQSASPLARYAGDYKYAGTREQGMAIVDRALDYALSDLDMITRPLVKQAINQRFAEQIHIEVAGNKVGIKVGDYPLASCELDKTVPAKGNDGKPAGTVGHKLDGSALVETYLGEHGSIVNNFELSADGKSLLRNVTVKGDQLKKAIRYKLQYVRK
jgi:hypothetical protein